MSTIYPEELSVAFFIQKNYPGFEYAHRVMMFVTYV